MANDPNSDAQTSQATATAGVIAAFGGLRPMGKKLGTAVSTLQGWQTRGQIPAARAEEIQAAAKREKIDLDPALLAAAVGRAETATGGEAAVQTTKGGGGEPPSGRVAEEADSPHPAGAPESRATPRSDGDHSAEEKLSGALAENEADGPAHERPEVAETRTTGGVEAASESMTGSADSPEPRQAPPPPPPAAPPVASSTPPESRRRGVAGPMLLGALLIVLGLVLAVMARDIWLPWTGIDTTSGTQDSLTALQQQVATLEERLATQRPGLGESEVTALLDRRLAALNAKFAGIATELQKLESAASGGADAASVAALRGDLSSLSTRVSGLADQLAAELASQGSGGEAALVLALVQLRDALRVTAPYEDALAALEARLAGGAAALSGPLQALQAHAASGLPTRRLLAERFSAVARGIASAGYAEDESWYGAILKRVNEVVSIRPVGSEVEGSGAAAVAARAEALIEAGDLHGAVAELESLSGGPAEAAAGWLSDAQARLAAEAALAEISTAAARRLAPAAPASSQ